MPCQSILIVEDDTDIRETLQQILELEGYTVLTASNGQEALDLLPQVARPCLILLDLMMPVMNGWEFLELKKKSDDISLATIPVVVVSAAGERAKQIPASGFIKKPIELESLIQSVRKY
ncbi:MAG: response regulator, partial [Bdellovibrionota bacterium]